MRPSQSRLESPDYGIDQIAAKKASRFNSQSGILSQKNARVVLTSGGLEPVLDAGGGKHSVFAGAFLTALRENDGIMDGTSLFQNTTMYQNPDKTGVFAVRSATSKLAPLFLPIRKIAISDKVDENSN